MGLPMTKKKKKKSCLATSPITQTKKRCPAKGCQSRLSQDYNNYYCLRCKKKWPRVQIIPHPYYKVTRKENTTIAKHRRLKDE